MKQFVRKKMVYTAFYYYKNIYTALALLAYFFKTKLF